MLGEEETRKLIGKRTTNQYQEAKLLKALPENAMDKHPSLPPCYSVRESAPIERKTTLTDLVATVTGKEQKDVPGLSPDEIRYMNVGNLISRGFNEEEAMRLLCAAELGRRVWSA